MGIQRSQRFRGTDGEVQESGRILNKVILRTHLCDVLNTTLPDKLYLHSDPGSGSSSTAG